MEFSAIPASPHVLLIKVRNYAETHRVFLLYHFLESGGGIHCAFQGADKSFCPFLVPLPRLHFIVGKTLLEHTCG